MSFTVTKSSQAMVQPAEPTPAGILDLSPIDRLPGLNAKVRTFHVFRAGQEPARVLRKALSKALVPYYPLAGRLVQSRQVDCTGAGAWFVEATADCRLEDLNYLSHPLAPSHHLLLPHPSREVDSSDILLLMQVTEFKCGGFVIGLESSHSIFDGLGIVQFLNSVAEFAKGLDCPSVPPVWCRDAIPSPPTRPSAEARLPPAMPTYRLEQATIDVSPDDISNFKSQYLELTGHHCSTFDALVARVWKRRTRAIEIEPERQVRLVFMANARPLVHPPLPGGFYGNCFFPVTVVAPSKWLVSASDVEVVKLIRAAKARLPAEFERWAAGENEEDPYVPSMGYGTLFVSEWSRLGLGEIDYGWGTAVQVVPLTYSDLMPVCILGSPPKPEKGARLITQCVEEKHLKDFVEHMMSSE